jgi:hypothetical protein
MMRGYILIETLTAMAVLSASILAINGAMRQGAITNAMARDYTHARFVLEQVVGSVELKQGLVPTTNSGRFGGDLSHYAWEYEITLIEMPVPAVSFDMNNPAHASLAEKLLNEDGELELPVHFIPKITATVSWSRGGRVFTETVETLMDPDRLHEEVTASSDAL